MTLAGDLWSGIIACEISNQIKINNSYYLAEPPIEKKSKSYLELIHPLIDYTPIGSIQHVSGKVGGELNQMFKNVPT